MFSAVEMDVIIIIIIIIIIKVVLYSAVHLPVSPRFTIQKIQITSNRPTTWHYIRANLITIC